MVLSTQQMVDKTEGVFEQELPKTHRTYGQTATATIPIEAVSPNKSAGENRFSRSARVKGERTAAREIFGWLKVAKPALPCVVLMTRLSPSVKGLDAHDNLRASLKPFVDGVADWLGIRDDDKRVEWRYSQEFSPEYFVRITVRGSGITVMGAA